MTQPTITVRGKTVAVYDKGDTSVRSYDRNGRIGMFTASGPILYASVAENGNIACAVGDGENTRIDYYDSDGDMIAEIYPDLNETGYPVSFALSPDGVLVSNGPGDPTDAPEGYHSQPNEGFNGKSKARRVGSLFLRCFSVPSSFTFLIVSGRSSGSPECCIGSDVCSGRDPFLFHGLFRIKCSGCSLDICGHVLASGAACPGTGGTGISSGENCRCFHLTANPGHVLYSESEE